MLNQLTDAMQDLRLSAFLNEQCDIGKTYSVQMGKLRQALADFLGLDELPHELAKILKQKLKVLDIRLNHSRTVDGWVKRYYGIRLKPDEQTEKPAKPSRPQPISQADIRREAEKIRAGWTEAERHRRVTLTPEECDQVESEVFA